MVVEGGSIGEDIVKATFFARGEVGELRHSLEDIDRRREFGKLWRKFKREERRVRREEGGDIVSPQERVLFKTVYDEALEDQDLMDDALDLADLALGGARDEDELLELKEEHGDMFLPMLAAGLRHKGQMERGRSGLDVSDAGQDSVDSVSEGVESENSNEEESAGGEQQPEQQREEFDWGENGWRDEWGDVPEFGGNVGLQNKLKQGVGAIKLHELRVGRGEDPDRKNLRRLKSRLEDDVFGNHRLSYELKEEFWSTMNTIFTEYMSDAVIEESFSLSDISASEYEPALHGAIPAGLKEEMKPLYKQLLMVVSNESFRQAIDSGDRAKLQENARKLTEFSKALLGSEGGSDGVELMWNQARQVELASLDPNGDDYQEQRDGVIEDWRQSRELFDARWRQAWGDIYREDLFGSIPATVINEMKPAYQQLSMIFQAPNIQEALTRRDYQELATARVILQSFEKLLLKDQVNWAEKKQFELARAAEVDVSDIVHDANLTDPEKTQAIDNRRRLAAESVENKWNASERAFQEFWVKSWDRVFAEDENGRRGTMAAFVHWAKDRKKLYGDYSSMNSWEKEKVGRRIDLLLEGKSGDRLQFEEDGPVFSYDDEFENFVIWLRTWMIDEMSDTMDANPNSFVSAAGQVSARLNVRGLETDVAIAQVISSMDTNKGEWKDLATDLFKELQTFSAIANRERLYARFKNLSIEKVAETMLGIANQSAGRGESLEMTGDSWGTIFKMGLVSSEEDRGDVEKIRARDKDAFGETFRKALALYLARSFNVVNGDLTVQMLDVYGIDIPDAMRAEALNNDVLFDGEGNRVSDYGYIEVADKVSGRITTGNVVARNIFPIELGGAQNAAFVEQQRKRMVDILEHTAGSRGAANLAEKLAFKAIETGYVGAQLDSAHTSKEAMFKALHTRIYRYKYLDQQKEAGLPLTVDDVEYLIQPYFDMVLIPHEYVNTNGEIVKEEFSFKEFILGKGMPERLDADKLPTHLFPATPDFDFYNGATQWASKMWDFLIQGIGIPWNDMLSPSGPKRSLLAGRGELNPQHIHTFQEFVKYVGYWIDSMSLDQIVASVDPHNPKGDKAPVIVMANHARLNESHPQFDPNFTEKTFKSRVKVLLTRRLPTRELSKFGEAYNEALKSINPFRSPYGTVLDNADIGTIEYFFLHEVSKLGLIEGLVDEDKFTQLFNEKIVRSMLDDAGVVGTKASIRQFIDILSTMATKASLLNDRDF